MLRFRDVHREPARRESPPFPRRAGAAGAVAGCDFSLADGVFNACGAVMPDRLRTHALVAAAWRGLDAARVWDVHCHVFGNGDSGSGLWINPAMERIWQPQQYLQRLFYLNAGCVHDSPGHVDASVVDRLLNQCEAMPAGFRALLFAFDWARDEAGRRCTSARRSSCPTTTRRAGRALSRAFRMGRLDPSPRSGALDRLDAAKARGARAVKWLPTAQGIDPASARCDRFYRRLADLRLPLITHAGDERAVRGFGEDLGNPLRLRRPLDAGVRVVVAHCASLGRAATSTRRHGRCVANFDLFARLMDEPRYTRNLAGDISAVTQGNRMEVVATLLARRDWHRAAAQRLRLSVAGGVPLISLPALVERELLDPAAVAPLRGAARTQCAAVRLRIEAQSRE